MLARVLLVAAVFLGAGLAGCIGNDDDAPGAVADGTNKTGVTDVPPDGRDGKIVAFEETNATEEGVGGVDHDHDYWAGRARVVMFEREAWMEPYPDDQNRAYSTFTPPQNTFVYEATASIEFTIANPERRLCPYGGTLDGEYVCSDYQTGTRLPDPNPPAGLKLRYKHASTIEWIDAGELTWGTPLVIKITDPRQTDMPHATSSLWEFEVVSPNAQDVTLYFDAKAEMVKGDADIPMWPGHPNFYAERPTREVLNVPDAVSCDGSLCQAGDEEKMEIYAQKLISYGTKSLHVWVNITEVQSAEPVTAPSNWFLYHVNATGRDNVTNQFDEASKADVKSFYWIFPVDDNAMDSPYADGSRWWFRLGGSVTTPVISCYENCGNWRAKYGIVIHATNEVLAPDQYTMYCLRDSDCPAA